MYWIGNFLYGATWVLDRVLSLLFWVIFIRAMLSWVNPDPNNFIVRLLRTITEPILSPIRRLIPMYRIGIDLSPMIAILVIWFLRIAVVPSLAKFAYDLGATGSFR